MPLSLFTFQYFNFLFVVGFVLFLGDTQTKVYSVQFYVISKMCCKII